VFYNHVTTVTNIKTVKSCSKVAKNQGLEKSSYSIWYKTCFWDLWQLFYQLWRDHL